MHFDDVKKTFFVFFIIILKHSSRLTPFQIEKFIFLKCNYDCKNTIVKARYMAQYMRTIGISKLIWKKCIHPK